MAEAKIAMDARYFQWLAYNRRPVGLHTCTEVLRSVLALAVIILPMRAIADSPSPETPADADESKSTVSINVMGVEGSSKRPLDNATVSVTGTRIRAQTDASGKATLHELPLKTLKLRVEKEGWTSQDTSLTLSSPQHTTTVELARLLTRLKVTVTGLANGTKLPLDGVEVRVQLHNGETKKKVTNSSGATVLENLPRGTVSVKIIPQEGWKSGFKPDYVLKDASQTLAIELNKRKPPGTPP